MSGSNKNAAVEEADWSKLVHDERMMDVEFALQLEVDADVAEK